MKLSRLALAFLLVGIKATVGFSEEKSPVAAVFNGRTITVAEIDERIKRRPNLAYMLNQASGNPEQLKKLRTMAVNEIINHSLLLEAAKKSGTIDEKEVKTQVEGVVAGYGGKEKLSELLTGMGSTFETFTEEISDDFRIRSYIEKSVLKDLKPSEEDLQKEFETNRAQYAQKDSVRARHILVKVEENASPEAAKAAEKKINDLYRQAVAPNSDFAALAKANSDCPSAAEGGDLGFFEKGMMVPEFEKEAFALSPGAVSKPLKTQFGYHIIKLEEKKAAAEPDFEQAKPKLEEAVGQRLRGSKIEAEVEKLRSGAKIEIKI